MKILRWILGALLLAVGVALILEFVLKFAQFIIGLVLIATGLFLLRRLF